MFYLDTKYGNVPIYATTIEQEAISQITEMANSVLGDNAHIAIMPDAHAGAGCTIGTTMRITDKVCPNLVGVDIACGVDLAHCNVELGDILPELDSAIHKVVPSGRDVHFKEVGNFAFEDLHCWDKLTKDTQELAKHSMGTLGGGNHFIEAYADGYLSVHSGSRNIGWRVADYYQKLAITRMKELRTNHINSIIQTIVPIKREKFIKDYKQSNQDVFGLKAELAYLTGADLEDYLHDSLILNDFAVLNRQTIISNIGKELGIDFNLSISSTHNYIDKDRILRKGSVAAKKNELLVIPMNMRDGILICRGKGNEDWNCSAPHGAGRLYSRSKAKQLFTVDEYAESMKGIYSSCINQNTLDEAPFVYKNFEEIERCIEPTVAIKDRLIPIYNFKAGE